MSIDPYLAPPEHPAETIALPQRGWQITPAHAWLAATLCWLGFALVTWLFHSGRLADFDADGLLMWRTGPNQDLIGPVWFAEAVRDITALGGVTLRIITSVMVVAALLFLRMRREAWLFLATVLSGWLAGVVIKALVGRPRPSIVRHLTDAGGLSFPSGHSFNAALGLIATALAFATLSQRREVRWSIVGGALVASWLVCFSRVLLGVHYPSDVIAGWLGGAGFAFLAAALFARAQT